MLPAAPDSLDRRWSGCWPSGDTRCGCSTTFPARAPACSRAQGPRSSRVTCAIWTPWWRPLGFGDAMFHLAAGAGVIESVEDPLANFDVNARGRSPRCGRRAPPACRGSCSRRPTLRWARAPTQPARKSRPRHCRPTEPQRRLVRPTARRFTAPRRSRRGGGAVLERVWSPLGPQGQRHPALHPADPRRRGAGGVRRRHADPRLRVRDRPCRRPGTCGGDTGVGGEVFQLASGVETSLNDLLAKLGEVSGREPRVPAGAAPRAGEIQRNYSLVDKAFDRLGYRPQVELGDGLRATWEYFTWAKNPVRQRDMRDAKVQNRQQTRRQLRARWRRSGHVSADRLSAPRADSRCRRAG